MSVANSRILNFSLDLSKNSSVGITSTLHNSSTISTPPFVCPIVNQVPVSTFSCRSPRANMTCFFVDRFQVCISSTEQCILQVIKAMYRLHDQMTRISDELRGRQQDLHVLHHGHPISISYHPSYPPASHCSLPVRGNMLYEVHYCTRSVATPG